MRKATLSETRHDECTSEIISLPSISQNSIAATKIDTEWEISPRPWKKIKYTYSSRTNSQSCREFVNHTKDRAIEEARGAVIRLPLNLTAGQVAGNDEALAAKNGQHGIPAQTGPLKAPRGVSKKTQTLHSSQVLGSTGSTGPGNRRLIEGICKALEALLRATTCEKISYDRGPRSLLSICLRRTPTYIAEEQRLANDENPENDIDVSSEVYNDLEALGSAPGGGWESLREVVRAHGVNLVGEAIQEGLVGLSLSRHILSLCLELAAYDEAECVIESMIALVKCRPLPSKESTIICADPSSPVNNWAASHRHHATPLTEETSLVAGALKYYVSQTGRHGFMYRKTAVMLGDGILPVEWISSKAMIDCWNGVIRSITQEDDHAQSAALLLQIAILKAYRREGSSSTVSPQVHDLRLHASEPTTVRPTLRSYKSGQAAETLMESQAVGPGEGGGRPDDIDNALQSTLSSILTVLSAINILRSPKSALDSSHFDNLSVAILQNTALEIRQVLEIAHVTSYTNRSWTLPTESLNMPLLAAGLVWIVSRNAGTKISPNEVLDLATLASLPSSKASVDNAGFFLGQVARCCDQAESGDGFNFVQVMVQDLISIATSNIYDKPTRRFCSGIAHAAAFAFSKDTGQPKHLDWALDVESTITRTDDDSTTIVVDKTPARALMRSKSGYKWEEGICEWIAKTPVLALQRPTAIEDVDSTYREAPKLTLVQASPLLSETSPSATDRRLPRPKRRGEEKGASCDLRETERLIGSCGISSSSERLLFIRVSPRPQKMAYPQSLRHVNAGDDVDELCTPESCGEKPMALREIANLPSGVKRKGSSGKHSNQMIGRYNRNLDMPLRKRHRLETETLTQDMDDELGFP